MKKPRVTAVVSLLCLSVLWTACRSMLTPNPAYPDLTAIPLTPEVTTIPMTILPIPTSEPYPIPTKKPTPEWASPGYTPPPKPTPVPTLVPTATPPPTALPLPPSAFDVLWAEVRSCNLDPLTILWVADPGDIANRREILRFDDKELWEPTISPDGRQIAFVTAADFCWHMGAQSPLWVVNVDGTDLRQIVPDAGQPLWSPDGRTIFYGRGEPEIEKEQEGWIGVERVDVATGETQRLFTIAPPISTQTIEWSADGQWFYQIRLDWQKGHVFELWKVHRHGNSQMITSLGEDLRLPYYQRVSADLTLSSDRSKLLTRISSQGFDWVSTDGQETAQVFLSEQQQSRLIMWGQGGDEAIVWERLPTQVHLYSIDVRSRATAELASLDLPNALWDEFYISPDYEWLLIHSYQGSYYWVHVRTGALVPVPLCPTCGMRFVGWVPNTP